jgi:hypothetical protein
MNRVFGGVLGFGRDPSMHAENAAPVESPRIVDLNDGLRCFIRVRRQPGAGAIGGAEVATQWCFPGQHRVQRQDEKQQQKERDHL